MVFKDRVIEMVLFLAPLFGRERSSRHAVRMLARTLPAGVGQPDVSFSKGTQVSTHLVLANSDNHLCRTAWASMKYYKVNPMMGTLDEYHKLGLSQHGWLAFGLASKGLVKGQKGRSQS